MCCTSNRCQLSRFRKNYKCAWNIYSYGFYHDYDAKAFGTVNSVVYVKIFPWRFLDEYDINAIRANIALDMVSGMYDYMALRETNSC